jgi:NAD(P)-dependent dehydrogenase (short-subunit alcohol dehydrogenase family)
MAPYNTTKAAVIALSETLHADLHPLGVGVTVLCPTFFRTNLVKTARTSADPVLRDAARGLVEKSKVSAAQIARAALAGVEADLLFESPQADGRWLWRLKRLAPEAVLKLSPRVAERMLARRGGGA